MERNNMMSKRVNYKKLGIGLFLAFILLIIISNRISYVVYNNNLTEVEVSSVFSGGIVKTYTTNGTINYEKQEIKVYSDIQCRVSEFYINDGDEVITGQPLLQYDHEDLELLLSLEQYDLQLYEEHNEKLTKRKDYEDLDELDKDAYDINTNRMNECLSDISILERLIEGDGVLYSEVDGIIEKVYDSSKIVQEGSLLVSIQEYTGEINLYVYAGDTFYNLANVYGVSSEDSSYINTIDAELNLKKLDDDGMVYYTRTIELPITEKKDNYLICSIGPDQIGADAYVNAEDGYNLSIELSYLSSDYDYVVPRTAVNITSGDVGNIFTIREKEKIFGKSYYVTTQSVVVAFVGDEYLALEYFTDGVDVVSWSDGNLIDEDEVKIKND